MNHNIPWIESPFFEQELSGADLTDAEKQMVKSYAEDGYIIIDPEIDEAIIDHTVAYMSQLKLDNRHLPVNLQNRVQDAWKNNTHVKQIATAPKVVRLLELLYRRKPIPFQTLNFVEGTQQRTHSDMIHFSSIPERFMCGVWVALEDVHENNGPLHYYPGSHKMKFFDMLDMGVRGSESKKMKNVYMDYSDFYENFIEEVVKSQQLKKKTLHIKKGQALVWAANLLHGGEKILQPGTTRFSQVTHYYFENCLYYTPLFSDLGIRKMFLRKIVDINTGKVVPNRYMDKTVHRSVFDRITQFLPQSLRSGIHGILKK